VIITGGISVGDYDFVQDALIALGVEELFYKISQKPGKPIYFGKVGNKFVAALPGNPASSLVGFYHYVLPALRKLSGKGFEGLTMSEKEMTEDFEAKGTRALFLHSWTNGSETTILSMQSSAMLRSFALANSYVYLPEPLKSVKKGDKVRVYHF
jgi:molybdopterin molybdotransferase